MKLLVITNLFPNAKEPGRAAFSFQQFSALAKLCELKVVAPVPSFKYSPAEVPAFEKMGGIDVYHPRYLVIPRILRWTYGLAFFAGIRHTLKLIYSSFKYDTILAAWAYPDAFGAALACRLLKKRFFVMVLGSDINLAHRYWLRPAMIRWALGQAEKIIAVSHPLKRKMVAMGVAESKIVVVQNGIDTKKFFPRPKDACRGKFGLDPSGHYILYAGNFAAVKGVSYLIRALALLPSDVKLLLVGNGEEKASLTDLAGGLGLAHRVIFAGRKPHAEIPEWMGAADVFCLPSLDEGCPNVLLEALACGTKVVASNVGGVPDIIDAPEKGWLAKAKDPADIAKCLKAALDAPGSSRNISTMSWDENAAQVFKLMVGTGR